MAMKKNISKALAMAVMMSVWCGSAYAQTFTETVEFKGDYRSVVIEPKDPYSAPVNITSGNTQADLYTNGLLFSKDKTVTSRYDSDSTYHLSLDGKSSSRMYGTGIFIYSDPDATSTYMYFSAGGVDVGNNVISNVGNGIKATDAVNKGQMDAELDKKADQTALDTEVQERKDADADLQKQIDAIGGGSSAGLNELNNKINQTNDRVDRVGATAAALAGIHYQPMAKGQSQVAIGMGGYKGKKATALGLAYQISDRVSGSVAGAANGSERMFNVGFNYLFGQHSDKDIAQMAAVPGSVSLKEAELQSEVDSLKAHIAKQDAEMAELKAMVKALAAK